MLGTRREKSNKIEAFRLENVAHRKERQSAQFDSLHQGRATACLKASPIEVVGELHTVHVDTEKLSLQQALWPSMESRIFLLSKPH